ncbi:unnamed protein product [Urochloa humidicola]
MDLRRKLQLCRVSLIVLVFVFFSGVLQAVVAVEILNEERRPSSGSTHPAHRRPVPCATSSLTKLNNNSLWASSPTSS